MRAVLYLLVSLLFLSCETHIETQEQLNTEFDTHILEGYFVKSIGFDAIGNTWVGTFKQGLINYKDGESVVFNSANSIIPDSTVFYAVEVDSKNNVWMGTSEGLIKYNGENFTVFNTENTPIPVDYISSVVIDSKDNIWFLSNTYNQGGLVKYDNTSWTVYTSLNTIMYITSHIQSIAIDSDDNVWLALNGYVKNTNLIKFSGDNWKIYNDYDLGFSPYYYAQINVSSTNELYMSIDYTLSSTFETGSDPRLLIFNGDTTIELKLENTENLGVISLDDMDNVWCAVAGGFALYDGEQWLVNDTLLEDNSIFVIEQASNGEIWLGTDDGIYINE